VAQIRNNKIQGNNNGSNGAGVLLFSPGAIALSSYGNHWDWEDRCGTHNSHIFYTIVQNNLISGNDYGIFGSGIDTTLSNQSVSTLIKNNLVYNNTYVGIEIDFSTRVDIENNCIHDNGSASTDFVGDGGIFLYQSSYNTVNNNSSTNNDGSGIFIDSGS